MEWSMKSKTVVQRVAALFLILLCGSASSSTAAILNPVVGEAELSARVFFLDLVDAQVTVSFEEVEGLSLESLGLSAQLVTLTDPSFTSRLPAGVSTVSALPIKLVIDPPANGGLSFRGLPTVTFETELPSYPVGTPLRMFAGEPGGPFRDVTASEQEPEEEWEGSYRSGGSKPQFAGEYVFILDHRLVDEVILDKLIWLEDTLEEHQTLIDPPVHLDLSDRIIELRQEIEDGEIGQALQELDAFVLMVRERSGTSIPNHWRAARDLINVAGDLRSIAATLRYSLQQAE